MNDILSAMGTTLGAYTLIDVLKLIALVLICVVVRKVMLKILARTIERLDVEKTLASFVNSILGVLLWVVIVMIVADYMGIPMTSLLAVLSVAGLAVSLAVQGILSNLAGGFTLLSAKPFGIGDFVEAGGVSGTVQEIGLYHTQLVTPDCKTIFVPNSDIASARIVNYSDEEFRRVDLVVSASYDAPVEKVESVLLDIITSHPKTLNNPSEPFARVSKYGNSAIEYTVRVWCAGADYWDVYFDVLKEIKVAFDANGIEMTYDHLNVHIAKD